MMYKQEQVKRDPLHCTPQGIFRVCVSSKGHVVFSWKLLNAGCMLESTYTLLYVIVMFSIDFIW